MFYVYLLESVPTKELYTGFTTNLKERLAEHNSGKESSTKRYAPWRCIYCELCVNEADARRREKYLKTSQGRRLIKRRLKEYFFQSRAKRNSTTEYAR